MSAGKIYHGRYGREDGKEFDELGPAASAAPFPENRLVDRTPQNHKLVDWGFFPHQDKEKGDYKIANWGIEKLNTKPKEPFFLALGFFLPHVPCFATQNGLIYILKTKLKLLRSLQTTEMIHQGFHGTCTGGSPR